MNFRTLPKVYKFARPLSNKMKFKNIVLGIGIFIIFMFLLHNGIRAFYDIPKYEDFCGQGRFQGYYPEKPVPAYPSNCTYSKQLREAEQQCYDNGGQPVYEYDDNGCYVSVKECDYCNKEFTEAMKIYNKNVFVIALVVGIIVLLTGYLILTVEPVGSALMASGIGAIMYGTITNWENLGNIGRFLLLLLAFILLIWIALKINKESKKGFLGFKKK